MMNEKTSGKKDSLEEKMGLAGNSPEKIWAHVIRLELAGKNKTRVVTSTVYGEYAVTIKDAVVKKLWIGDMLEAGLQPTPSSLTDFIGQKQGHDDAVTMSYELDYLRVPGGNYVYKRNPR